MKDSVCALINLRHTIGLLEKIVNEEAYTIDQMTNIRKILLNTVRDHVDPCIGHMPDKRHYYIL